MEVKNEETSYDPYRNFAIGDSGLAMTDPKSKPESGQKVPENKPNIPKKPEEIGGKCVDF